MNSFVKAVSSLCPEAFEDAFFEEALLLDFAGVALVPFAINNCFLSLIDKLFY
jgi:hypothetical protein